MNASKDIPTTDGTRAALGCEAIAPATPVWLPPELAPFLPELAGHVYEDNAHSTVSTATGWRALGATRRGWHHRHEGGFREDAFAFATDLDAAVVCVGDGLGSCPLSRIGSEFVTREASRSLLASFSSRVETPIEDRIIAALEGVSRRLYHAAERTGRSFKEFRTTLLAAVLIQRPPEHRLICLQIGDGTMVAVRLDGRIEILGAADAGDVGGEVTKCMPDAMDIASGVRANLTVRPAEDLAALILYTDGVEIPFAFHPELVVGQLCEGVSAPLPGFRAQAVQPPVLQDPSPAESLQRWLGFEKRGAGDDRTIAILHRPGVAIPPVTFHRQS